MLQTVKSSLASIFGMLIAQTGIVFVLYFMCAIISMFTMPLTGNVVSGLITFSLYALIWALIWWTLYVNNGISQFFLKLTFAMLPLIIFTVWYIRIHPTPDYTMMIPLLPADIHFYFASAVTGTLLFPLYSIHLKRCYSMGLGWIRFLWGMSLILILGVISFSLCYNLLPAKW